MKILVVTTLYPNAATPHRAVFVRQFCAKLKEYAEIRILAPVPYFPPLPWFKRWNAFRAVPQWEETENGAVEHPRYLVLPKVEMLTGWLYLLSVLPAVRRIRSEFPFDCLNVHWAYPDGFAMALAGRLLGCPVVLTAHGSDIYSYRNRPLVNPLLRWAFGQVQAVVAVSEALKQAIGGIGATRRLAVIPCAAINPDIFAMRDQRQCRQRLGLADAESWIVFIGNLVPVKGCRFLVEAFAQLKAMRAGQTLRLAIVGDGPERAELESLADRLGIRPQVVFAGRRPHHEIPEWMNSADIFCLPSLSEGMPNVAVEAMACGRPVVASRVGGLPDLVPTPWAGLLVPAGDSEQLAGALAQAVGRDWDAKAISDYARKMTWDDIAKRFVALAATAISGSQSTSKKRM